MSELEHIGSILTRVLEDIDNASTGVSGILKPNGAKEGIMKTYVDDMLNNKEDQSA